MQIIIKTLLLAIATAAMASPANAQGRTRIKTDDYREPVITERKELPDAREKITVGLKAGANYSGVYSTTGEAFKPKGRFGFAGGGFVGIPFGTILGVQPEILFSQKGFNATGKVSGALYDIARTTSYIDVPVFLAVKPSKYYTLLAGPQFSYLIQQKDVFTFPPSGTDTLQAALKQDMNKSMFAVVAGGDISSKHMVLSLRAGIDLQYNKKEGTNIPPRYKNRWVQLTIGYLF